MSDFSILNTGAQTPNSVSRVTGQNKATDMGSWYEAMAQAWGDTLDAQAAKITDLSDAIGNGGQDNPSTITLLTAESMRMQFLANNAATATTTVGQALEALARK